MPLEHYEKYVKNFIIITKYFNVEKGLDFLIIGDHVVIVLVD